jgi:hypothetical protein
MDLLIEAHMPIAELGAEARRENSTGQHPPPNRLHVWWARRPLVVSRAAVLGSLLPSWSEDWPEELRRRFPDEGAYREWFLRDLLGIRGDPVRARRAIDVARQRGARVANPYGYERAFAFTPSEEDLAIAGKLLALA